jgi:gamma-glutamylcyclotransferase (GGCT)/AIG2-like uncharacterized protein YtfP
MKKILIAVYGTLRLGHGNYQHLLNHEGAEHLGTFKTEPIFNLYNLGGFPGLKEKGDTAVTMDVFSVDERTAARVDQLEGYSEGRSATFYDKIMTPTPYGEAGVYIYVGNVREENKIESGDYSQFREGMYAARH